MTIKAHCMGTEFPKRDTDSPNVDWLSASTAYFLHEWANKVHASLPSAADLDAVAEEQRVKEATRCPHSLRRS